MNLFIHENERKSETMIFWIFIFNQSLAHQRPDNNDDHCRPPPWGLPELGYSEEAGHRGAWRGEGGQEHQRGHQKPKAILLRDSHMEALVLLELEKITHFDLVALGAHRARNITTMGGHEQRAYNPNVT